jgi:hypothetical protein
MGGRTRTASGDRNRHDDRFAKRLLRDRVRCRCRCLRHTRHRPRLGLPLILLQPLQEPLPRRNNPMIGIISIKLPHIPLDLAHHPVHIHLRLRALHPLLCKRRNVDVIGALFLSLGETGLGELTPVAVHHVGLVELDFEEEGGAGGVGRSRGVHVSLGRRLGDVRAHDEALERLAVPFLRGVDLVRELFHLRDGVEHDRLCDDEPPVFGELLDDVREHGLEFSDVLVEAVQVEAGAVLGVGEDVLFEGVVAQLEKERECQ